MKRAKSDLILKWNASESAYITEQKEQMHNETMEQRQRYQSELQCLEKRLLTNVSSFELNLILLML
jgi:hypothetical protein